MSGVNILPGNLTVVGNVSATSAGIGGNLVVGSNIYVTGNLYSANVSVSGGASAGVSSLSAGNGLTSSGTTGAVTISAVVAGLTAGTNVIITSNNGVYTINSTGGGGNPSNWAQYPASQNVDISGYNISGFARIASGNIDLKTGQDVSRIGNLQINYTSGVGNDVVFYPMSNGSVRLTGSSDGTINNSLRINSNGSIENQSTTSNNIGGVQLNQRTIGLNVTPGNGSIALLAQDSNISRWNIGTAYAGEDFTLWRYDNAGTIIDVPLIINRSNGNTTLTGAILNPSNTSNNIGGVRLYNNIVQPRVQDLGGGTSFGMAIINLSDKPRWGVGLVNVEGANDVGSDFVIGGYDNAGSFKNNYLYINRSNGQVSAASGFTTSSNTSNNIGGVILSNGLIRNDNTFLYLYPDSTQKSRIGSFNFDSVGGNSVAKLQPFQSGTIELTGSSVGSNPVVINQYGSISNPSKTSNNIGGVTMNRSQLVAYGITSYSQSLSTNGTILTLSPNNGLGIYDILLVAQTNWSYRRSIMALNEFFTVTDAGGGAGLDIQRNGSTNVVTIASTSDGGYPKTLIFIYYGIGGNIFPS